MRPTHTSPIRSLQAITRSRAAKSSLGPRFFTQQAQLLLISRSSIRPQLPFLHTSRSNTQFPNRLARLLTTENRKALRDNFKLLIKTWLYIAVALVLWYISKIGFQQAEFERKYPEPPEYSMISKWWYRTAKGQSHPSSDNAIINWLSAGKKWKWLIKRLEDPHIDGAGLRPRLGEGEELSIPGVGKTGFDITAKSEKWRRGYHEALMGAAKCGENLDGWVEDTTIGVAFPPENVIGPSNPRPKPVPYGYKRAPKEENCVKAFDEPEVYYMRILTTEGFTPRQKLDAALAYADWLQYKGLVGSASDMYDWAVDIATAHGPANLVDKTTGILKDGISGISENIILAVSAVAMHKSQIGDLSRALPMYLSILRAQRSLPQADPTLFAKVIPVRQPSKTWYGQINDMFVPPPYPEAPPTGDEIATRTPTASCDEATTMAHIGEIIYASALSGVAGKGAKAITNSQEAGLSWTRDAVELAEATVKSMTNKESPRQGQTQGSTAEDDAKTRCVECLAMAVDNWKTMVYQMQELEKQQAEKQPTQTRGWLWNSSSAVDTTGRWKKEEEIVAARERELNQLLRVEGLQMREV